MSSTKLGRVIQVGLSLLKKLSPRGIAQDAISFGRWNIEGDVHPYFRRGFGALALTSPFSSA
jgi:hypothetical protein